jgi:hypothetical protein
MKKSDQKNGVARRVGLALTVAMFGAVVGLIDVTGASASMARFSASRSSSASTSTAVVTPLLELFEFGNQIGLPLLCSDAGSVVSIFGSQTGTSKELSPLLVELDKECGQLSAQGGTYLRQAIAESQGLSLINPLVNPLIADLAGGLVTTGTQYGPALAPFGPTVAGLGGTVAFFEGS